jgi:hypothetical protein
MMKDEELEQICKEMRMLRVALKEALHAVE